MKDAELGEEGPGAAGTSDAGPSDAGPSDAGPSDAGPSDAGPSDAGPSDAGPSDAGPSDAGPSDAALVDWDLAARTAIRLTRPGPPATRAQAERTVTLLRAAAEVAPSHVSAVTELDVPTGPGAEVVERGAWVRANTDSFRHLLGPVLADAVATRSARRTRERTQERRREHASHRAEPAASLPGTAVARRVTGTQLGALLALLAPRVLGQYDALGPGQGRLLLVAPNVLAVARELDVDLADFSLWVTLHEETHRVQFAAAPWLADHLRTRARAMASDLLGEPGAVTERLLAAARGLPAAVRSARTAGSPGAAERSSAGNGLVDLAMTPAQRQALAEVTAVMSLLEGHADVMMDAVGPSVVPSVARIRQRFSQRRTADRGLLDQLIRSGLGLEAKLRQYADGARFVRGVTGEVGTRGLNVVWTSPAALPSAAEIADPAAWVRRVHG